MKALRILCKVIIFIFILIACVYAIIQPPFIKKAIASFIEQQTASENFSIKIDGLSGNIPFSPSVKKISIADKNGSYLEIDNISLAWGFDFSKKTIVINNIIADKINLLRTPSSDGEEQAEIPSEFSIPKIPHVIIEKISAPEIILPNGSSYLLSGQNIKTFYEEGSTSLLNLKTLQGIETTLNINITNENSVTNIKADFKEASGGYISSIITPDSTEPITANINGVINWPEVMLGAVLKSGAAELFNFKADGSGENFSQSKINYHLNINFPYEKETIRLASNGNIELNLPDWKFTILNLNATLPENNSIKSLSPLIVKKESDRTEISPSSISIAGGVFDIGGFYSTESSDISASIKNFPLKILNNNISGGTLNTNIKITGAANTPTVNGDVNIKSIRSPLYPSGSVDIKSTLILQNNILDFSGNLKDKEGSIDAKLSLPINISLSPFYIKPDKHKPISGAVKANASLTGFSPLFMPDRQSLKGNAIADLKISGTILNPELSGNVNITKGSYENLSTGTLISDITLKAIASNNKITITNATAKAGKGNVTAKGEITINETLPMLFNVTLAQADILNSHMATGSVNGTIKLDGNIDQMTIGGDISLDPLSVNIPEGSSPDVEQVKLLNKETLPKQSWQKDKKESTEYAVNFDLKIRSSERVMVRGRGIETGIRGEIDLKGNLHQPLIYGELQTLRGTYTLLDRRLDITEGILTFRGAIPPSPFINLTAETVTKSIAATIRVTGPANGFSLALTSSPSMPENEIMAYLLFGRDLRSITPFQAIQLGQALQTLRGEGSIGGGKFDIMGKARNLLGVQRLSVGKDDNGGVNVGAGKYISEKVYIGVESGSSENSGKVKAEIELTPSFSIETETGNNSGGVIFNWKRDY